MQQQLTPSQSQPHCVFGPVGLTIEEVELAAADGTTASTGEVRVEAVIVGGVIDGLLEMFDTGNRY